MLLNEKLSQENESNSKSLTFIFNLNHLETLN